MGYNREAMSWLHEVLTNAHIANAASTLGFVATIVGFFITIWNVLRSRSAAEQAKAAVAHVQTALARVDAVADVSSAVTTMEEIKRLQRQLAWEILPDRYAALRKHLITIRASFKGLDESQRVQIQSAIQHFSGIENLIERSTAAELSRKDVARLNKIMSTQIDTLHELLTTIRVNVEG